MGGGVHRSCGQDIGLLLDAPDVARTVVVSTGRCHTGSGPLAVTPASAVFALSCSESIVFGLGAAWAMVQHPGRCAPEHAGCSLCMKPRAGRCPPPVTSSRLGSDTAVGPRGMHFE